MHGKVSIFLSGKMISAGTKGEDQAQKQLQLTKQFLVNRDIIKDTKIKTITQNIVATVDFEQLINLEELTQKTRVID